MNAGFSSRIYLDHAATTPLRAEVASAMIEALAEGAYNPSSLHAEGRRARAVVDAARDRIAGVLGVRRQEVVFTGSGTEADNLAVLGASRAAAATGSPRRHVVLPATEHKAVLNAAGQLAREGFELSFVPVDEDGVVTEAALERALRPDTLLVSVAYANNELGVVQPVARLAERAHAAGALFHTDAVQAPGWLPVRVPELGADLLSLSAHKLFGPKGVGLLVARRELALEPVLYGGGQEFGRRSGTENVAGIAGFAVALELAESERAERVPRVAALRECLEGGILAGIPDVRINARAAPRLAHVSNVSFANVTSEALLARLDLEGIAVSGGSACASGVLEPSHVLTALGLDRRWLEGAVRFSLGPATTAAHIDRVLAVLPKLVASLK